MRSLLGDHVLLRLQQETGGALHQRLFHCLRNAIIEGVLPVKTRLPASRDLAREINVSRNTVLSAYEQLQSEGYVEARTGHGTWVSEHLPESFLNTQIFHPYKTTPANENYLLSQRGTYLLGHASASPYQWGAFVPGAPDVTEFPHHIFSRIQADLSREPDINHLIYSNAGGCVELRQALADYLRVARSVQCDTDQIIITEGVHQAIDLVSRALTDLGDHVWIEDPAYWGALNMLRINGLNIVPMPVDAEGMRPETNPTTLPKLIFVTPSHQYPLGSRLSLARRKQLLELAKQHSCWIVEDDYDSEFRFAGQPYPALQGLIPNAPVIYMGTFSKTIYPALRIGYLIVPKALFTPLRTVAAELYRGGHLLTQRALAEFIRGGHYEAHIRRMRLLYGKRRAYLVKLIQRYLGNFFLHEFDEDSGLHLVMQLPNTCDDVNIATAALQRGVKVRPLSQYYMHSHAHMQRGLLLGFACVEEKEMLMAFGVLLQCLKEAGITTLQNSV
ncbi:PLP-dependent aminotransferase family protein [Acinetobacter nematophilus]|uniref:PLP-dependent aminotransferase family protein n=1 Tax=Acinetobacter nematophilus TaxID=2994642 RepID=A0A9X3DWZ5_9GAMM|nr:PLP-dependent aminotransferase family protein [Acinetobacter nematophilus]MCX5469999.1 PLP-dependent aminotransferase family protein [Acinetobacter nematophilus]